MKFSWKIRINNFLMQATHYLVVHVGIQNFIWYSVPHKLYICPLFVHRDKPKRNNTIINLKYQTYMSV